MIRKKKLVLCVLPEHILMHRGLLRTVCVGDKNTGRKSRNVTAHGDAWEEKWRGNWQMEWVASTLQTTSEHGVLPLMRTLQLPLVDWTDASADLNGLLRFAERRNLVSARVPSHFRRSLRQTISIPYLLGTRAQFLVLFVFTTVKRVSGKS